MAGRARAILEVLRAPLLLSPIADVLAGWCALFGAGVSAARGRPWLYGPYPFADPGEALLGWTVLVRAMGVGVCLLAAGMAQNALVDFEDDRRRKPQRPLPRGAISSRAVRMLWLSLSATALVLAWTISLEMLACAGLIVLLTSLYHDLTKRWRLVGSLNLGLLRGLDMLLGGFALLAFSKEPPGEALRGAALDWGDAIIPAALAYAAYITGAALHASTDDELKGPGWSRLGLGLSLTVLLFIALTFFALPLSHMSRPIVPLALVLLASCRLVVAWVRLSAPAVTGVALSNLYLFDATVCGGARLPSLAWSAVVVCLALFALSRFLLRWFPPT